MKNSLVPKSKAVEKKYKDFIEFFSNPVISGICQINPIAAGISSYIGGVCNQEQFKTLENFFKFLEERVKKIESSAIDKEFVESAEGQRIVGKVLRSIWKDNRQEKLKTMANLTANIYQKSKLSIDERDLYVDILDSLNPLQLSILQKAVIEIKSRQTIQHRGFGWESYGEYYEKQGITRTILLHSMRVLESNGIINENDATVVEKDKTHFVTAFGEQFYSFIFNVVKIG